AVARLAGLPGSVIDRARKVLSNLESRQLDREGVPVLASRTSEEPVRAERESQLGLFPDSASRILQAVRDVDPDSMTPIEAINFLAGLKRYFEK
ncbi:MAG: DNA mismatch repair protein MutS, partial [Proteobacteria bacterium]|nr:DNA mismatch repair protein MutS [Pseudomonadota bacterium]